MARAAQNTRYEILTQPEAWLETLDVLYARAGGLRSAFLAGQYRQVVFIGSGPGYALAQAAAAFYRQQAFQAGGEFWPCAQASYALPSFELRLPPLPAKQRGALLVVFDARGDTPETLRAVERFRAARQGDVLALTCYAERPLARLEAASLVLPAGQEKSPTATRSTSTLFLAAIALAAAWTGQVKLFAELQALPTVCRDFLDAAAPLAQQLGGQLETQHFYFLGSAWRYGLAYAMALNMKAMAQSHAEAYHAAEFRSAVPAGLSPETLVVSLQPSLEQDAEGDELQTEAAPGGRTLSLGESGVDLAFGSGLSEAAAGPLSLPFGQLLALERALALGRDPDRV